ncbi:S8 family peptidase [Winogradskyella psychrotolerans]|uniref:S8 family peptidase n=1 Tax=Winogradskyella psychrotolerans TaxID=1344585 RepID=UPI001C07578B|nr:S8/S53 family peptidase [Winogradskyella psychrotolerans]MBU2927494.1 S8/S53 family peptidase [Winogradskyella psychrotolerans]
MKKMYTLIMLVIAIIIVSCSKDAITDSESEAVQFPEEPLTITQINERISESIRTTGDFYWSNEDAHFLWSALTHGQHVLTVGYGNEGQSFGEEGDTDLENKKNSLLATILNEEHVTKEDFKLKEDDILTVFDAEVTKLETIIALRESEYVRYLEPNGYNQYTAIQQKSSSGCDTSADSINSAHYSTIAPNNAQVSWHFDAHNIRDAWNISTGSGVTIGLIDTGVSKTQSLLNSVGINDGYSSGRFVQKYGTFIDSNWWWSSNYDGPHDKCGHGTAMGSTMAAPRNDNGMPVGVAYNSNLVAYRATEDVLLNDYHERKGVSQALKDLGDRSDVKIISMSIGYVWSIGNIKDAVRYAYSKGKLIFAAGGTSTSFTNGFGVIFPATMSETVAVTGVNDGSSYERCDTCHSGSKIDFTIIMEGDNNTSKAPPVLGFNDGQRRYTGGSSVATATTAGIAALIWSKYPSWSRTQVLNRLKQSSEFYPNKNSSFGYGNIDALEAVQ